MKTLAGQTYRNEWRRLAMYLAAQWPDIHQGGTVDTAVYLLEHLRRIDAGEMRREAARDDQLMARVAALLPPRQPALDPHAP